MWQGLKKHSHRVAEDLAERSRLPVISANLDITSRDGDFVLLNGYLNSTHQTGVRNTLDHATAGHAHVADGEGAVPATAGRNAARGGECAGRPGL